MFIVALVLGQPLIALALVVVAGAVLGFLFFNFPPATVFLGNSGSLFVGFLLASLGLAGSSKATTMLAMLPPRRFCCGAPVASRSAGRSGRQPHPACGARRWRRLFGHERRAFTAA